MYQCNVYQRTVLDQHEHSLMDADSFNVSHLAFHLSAHLEQRRQRLRRDLLGSVTVMLEPDVCLFFVSLAPRRRQANLEILRFEIQHSRTHHFISFISSGL